MTPAHRIASLVLVLTGTVLSHAQTTPSPAAVKVDNAEVRSGPGIDPKLYVTNRLRKGDIVQVLKARNEVWLEIKPPAGSFSWINTRFIDPAHPQNPTRLVVTHDDYPVPVLIGSEVINGRPTVEGTRLARGTLVIAVGKAMIAPDEGEWLPIEPPPQEVRFIKAEEVQPVKVNEPPVAGPAAPAGPPASHSVSGGAPAPFDAGAAPAPVFTPVASPGVNLGGSGGAPTPTTTTTSNTPQPGVVPAAPADPNSPEGMWLQAEQLAQTGQKAEAEALYSKIHSKFCNSTGYHDLAMRCLNRIQFLKAGFRPPAQPASVPAALTSFQKPVSNTADVRYTPTPTGAYGQPTFNVTACPGTVPSAYPASTSPAPTLAPQSIGPGMLRVAGRSVDYQRTYALDDLQGRLLMYVTAPPGVDLNGFVNRKVSLYGPMVYRGDLNANFMSAMSVTVVP